MTCSGLCKNFWVGVFLGDCLLLKVRYFWQTKHPLTFAPSCHLLWSCSNVKVTVTHTHSHSGIRKMNRNWKDEYKLKVVFFDQFLIKFKSNFVYFFSWIWSCTLYNFKAFIYKCIVCLHFPCLYKKKPPPFNVSVFSESESQMLFMWDLWKLMKLCLVMTKRLYQNQIKQFILVSLQWTLLIVEVRRVWKKQTYLKCELIVVISGSLSQCEFCPWTCSLDCHRLWRKAGRH